MKLKSSSAVYSEPRTQIWRLVAVMLAALLVATMSAYWAGSASADDDNNKNFIPRQVIVEMKGRAKIGAINKEYRTRTLEKFPGSKVYLIKDRKKRNLTRLISNIRSDKRVLRAEPNYRTESPEGDPHRMARGTSVPEPSKNSEPYRGQYAMNGALSLSDAHSKTRGRGAVVAVLDTGVQMGHPELKNRITGKNKRRDFVDGRGGPADSADGKDNDRDGVKDEMVGHGTHVAGVVRLAAPQARIMPVRVLNSDGRSHSFVVAKGIEYAERKGADVINLSLGVAGESEFLDDVIDDAAEEAVVVAAAGNSNSSRPHHPAAEEDVLAVTSANEQLNKSDFANYGRWVDVAAPGSNIYSLFPRSKYASWSGTSMATPFVAGQAALIRSERPRMGAEDVGCRIKSTARPLEGDKRLGGHADAAASLPSNGARCLAGGDDDGGNDGGDD